MLGPVQDAPVWETEDDLPEGVVQPVRFPAHAANTVGDPPDPEAVKEAEDKAAFEAWKASQETNKEDQGSLPYGGAA